MRTARLLAMSAAVAGLAGVAAADPITRPPTAADFAAMAKLPDWSGTWAPARATAGAPRAPAAGAAPGAAAQAPAQRPAGGAATAGPRGGPRPSLTPAAAKMVEEFEAAKAKGENLQTDAANCVPAGVPNMMRMPYPIEFIFSPERVTIITETESQVRRIYTDGRPLPEDPDPTFNGSSIGHWEGDTLVVDTIGLNPRNSIVPGLHATPKTRVHETFRLDAPDHIAVVSSITDPDLFTAPYVTQFGYARHRDWQIREYICQENNKDAADPFGRPSMSISK